LLASLHFRHGAILDPVRRTLAYRLMLASIAGWLGAWFLLPFSFLPIPATHGFFVPGAIFGVLVMVPMLDAPGRHPLRAATLVWAATVAYAMMWFAGMVIIEVLDTYASQLFGERDWSPLFSEDAILLSLLGGPAGIVFGVIVSLAMSRVLNLHLARIHWFLIAILSGICGTAYAGVVTEFWPEWLDALDRHTFDGFPVFLTHIFWYILLGAIFDRGRQQTMTPTVNTDYGLLGALILLSLLVGWSLGLENYPYEWLR
jgi:hypothetical protein